MKRGFFHTGVVGGASNPNYDCVPDVDVSGPHGTFVMRCSRVIISVVRGPLFGVPYEGGIE